MTYKRKFRPDSGRCDFERNFCNWEQSDQDNFDFQRGQGSTDTSYTGPQMDHTKGNTRGHYAFIDSTHYQSDHRARLVSHSLPAADICKFRLYYHMFGSGVGSLIVFKRDTTSGSIQELWRTTGDQGFQWLFASIDVSGPNQYQVLIEATVVGHERGDIAIDDLSFARECYLGLGVQTGTYSPSTTSKSTATLQWTGQHKPWMVPVIAASVIAVIILAGVSAFVYHRKSNRLNDGDPIINPNQPSQTGELHRHDWLELQQQNHPPDPPPPYTGTLTPPPYTGTLNMSTTNDTKS
ncbi:MAM and LDL-receptor class A domain-containing protein 1-like [Branchiostoma floridae x Branchiostoma japonicum]